MSPPCSRSPGRLCRHFERTLLGCGQPQRKHDVARIPIRERRAPHSTAHDATGDASDASRSSSMLHMVFVTPAAMAGVQRIVEWRRTRL